MFRLLHISCDDAHLVKCRSVAELAIGVGDACVFEMEKTNEFGRVAALLGEGGENDAEVQALPVVVRRATLQDLSRAGENVHMSRSAARLCAEKIKELHLLMRLLRVRYSLDRSRLTVAFSADDRVDFRQLVQVLTAETRARVEMRQIGARDAAAMVGGMAPCGRRLCCASWLEEFENVNIKMAKHQGLSLNPVNINGMCGRLKCCLRFEDNCYRDLGRTLPREGCQVECAEGRGKVIETRILAQRVRVLLEDRRVMEFDAADVKMLGMASSSDDNAPS